MGAGWREKMVDAIPPVAAENPSGSSDDPKLWDTRRRCPLKDEEAFERFCSGVGGESSAYVLGFWESTPGNGSALLSGECMGGRVAFPERGHAGK